MTVSWNGSDVSYNNPWTTQAERNAIDSAVSSAQAVVNNYYATQTDIANAINNLNNAIWTYKSAYKYGNNGYYVDKTQLTNLIYSVQYVASSQNNGLDIPVGYNTPWTHQYEKDALLSAVSSAQAVVNNYNSTQNDINVAITNLNAAISTYNQSIKYTP